MTYTMFILNYIVLIIFILVGVAFITLLERKILGYIQIRKGPNKVSVGGLLQPFTDAMKLFTKETTFVKTSNKLIYYLVPVSMIMLTLFMWMIYFFKGGGVDFKLGVVFFLCCSSLSVYMLFGSGWASNSKYALLGALRGVAQTISYEVVLALIILGTIILVICYDLKSISYYQILVWMMWVMLPLCFAWFVCGLAETNRTPFDFSEGESELVSGFNVEYSSGLFAFMFMSEYGNIIFYSYLTSKIYLGSNIFMSFIFTILLIVLFIWMRGTMPRFRYDKLMYLAWKSYLPFVLNYLIFLGGYMYIIIWIL
uniref:NADH-ubiquinone oxidoreductase chain 1 n=1 Tax=Anaulaciulus koreanus TaxID=1977246 RepID=A0A1W5SZ18_9MYRI|nr:NADH dehydrogenase subunit 1 [Anaulaciulus koreanus]ARF02900.1 NADH dehydrogenase subunit 1 [Anaulaciulus koreanus]